MRERYLEHKLVLAVEKRGGRAIKFSSPGRRGVPDRLVLFPGGRAVFVEMKSPGKLLGPLQIKWRERLESLGFKVLKIDSDEGIKEFVEGECKNVNKLRGVR